MSLGPTVPGTGARLGELVMKLGGGLLASVACERSVPKAIRQLNKTRSVIKPVVRGLNISKGVYGSVIYPR